MLVRRVKSGHTGHLTCLGMDAERTLEQMVETLGDLNIQSWVAVLEHDLFHEIRAQLFLVLNRKELNTSPSRVDGQVTTGQLTGYLAMEFWRAFHLSLEVRHLRIASPNSSRRGKR